MDYETLDENMKIKNLFWQVKLSAVMHKKPIMLQQKEPFYKVGETLKTHKIKHLLIVNSQKALVGLMTLQDFYKVYPREFLEESSSDVSVGLSKKYDLGEMMTKDPETMTEDDTVMAAMIKMVKGGYGCLPIVNEKNIPVGIVTQTDIIKTVVLFFAESLIPFFIQNR